MPTRRRDGDGGRFTIMHVYLLGVVILGVLAAILISQQSEKLRLGREVVKLERQESELKEHVSKMTSQVEGLRSVSSLRSALTEHKIQLESRPLTPPNSTRARRL